MTEASVIVPVHNGAPTLAEQLNSLAHQVGAPSYEVIVVDDHSTDDTARIICTYSDRFPGLFKGQKTHTSSGPSAARNTGVEESVGTQLLFCDADDRVSSTWVQDMTRALRSDALVTGPLELFTTGPEGERSTGCRDNIQSWNGVCMSASSANLGIRREIFATIDGFDESLRAAEDVDLCIRAHRAGYSVASGGGTIKYRERRGLIATASQQGAYAYWDTKVCLKFSDLLQCAGKTVPTPRSTIRSLAAQIIHIDRLPRSLDTDLWAAWIIQLWNKWNRFKATFPAPVLPAYVLRRCSACSGR